MFVVEKRQNGVDFEVGYLHKERVFCYKVISFFIIHQDLSFGGLSLKIELVAFVYELFIYEIIFYYLVM